MSDPNNLILEHLRGIRAQLQDIHASQAGHSRRLHAIEVGLQRLRADLATDTGTTIERSAELEDRLATIERRLELRDQ